VIRRLLKVLTLRLVLAGLWQRSPNRRSQSPGTYIYRAAHRPKIVGSVQAADADEAVQKAAQEFKVHAWRLIAVQQR
jgi:hypothetical protein